MLEITLVKIKVTYTNTDRGTVFNLIINVFMISKVIFLPLNVDILWGILHTKGQMLIFLMNYHIQYSKWNFGGGFVPLLVKKKKLPKKFKNANSLL